MSIHYQQECLADWQKFNSFNWHPKTDVRIAQEMYVTYLSFMDSCTREKDKTIFLESCHKHPNGDVMLNVQPEKLWKHHTQGEKLPETLADILAMTKVFEDVLLTIKF